MSSIKEKLVDLQNQAREESTLANISFTVLKKYLENGKDTLDDIENGNDFFAAIAFLNAQAKSPKIEHFIRKKLCHNAINSTEGKGDGEKDGVYYEYKISTTNKNKKINALQIRLWQKVDYYLLGYIDEKQFVNSRLFLVPHENMKDLCSQYGTATHGTKGANKSNENVEMSLRIEMETENELLAFFENTFRAINLEELIFNH